MRQCKQCGATFLSGESLCAYCGEPLIPGAKRKDEPKDNRQNKKEYKHRPQGGQGWDFSAFGNEFSKQNTGPPPIKMFRRNRWDSFIAAALAFTLGTFGAHWFFLGNRRRGFWYAIFFWTGIPTILGIIDGAKLLGGAAQDHF